MREAHPTSGWRIASNDKAGVTFDQPTTDAERVEVASQCCAALKMTIPLVVDKIDDHVGHLYSGMPDRLYFIDRAGKVAYKGGRGPFGFKPGELEQQIAVYLAEERAMAQRFPMPPSTEAWTKLPLATTGQGGPMPAWAKITARSLPRATATYLELDDLHRTKSPLDPKLRAMARWTVADVLRCPASKEVALADLKLAGGTDAEVKSMLGDQAALTEETRRILKLARQLTLAAYKVTDEQMAAVRTDLGDPKLVALVQLVAFGNFQDRMLHSLGVADLPDGPPTGVRFQKPWEGGNPPPRPKIEAIADATLERVTDPDWRSIDFAGLQKFMDAQKAREPRVSVPTFDDVKKYMSKDAKPLRIKWSLVCLGHSPILAAPWTGGMRWFAEDSKQDRVFEELLFWVITREIQCFY